MDEIKHDTWESLTFLVTNPESSNTGNLPWNHTKKNSKLTTYLMFHFKALHSTIIYSCIHSNNCDNSTAKARLYYMYTKRPWDAIHAVKKALQLVYILD